jgi:hypothetical protein
MMSDQRRRLMQLALVFCVVGLLVSQFHPLFGDPKVLVAEPWSPLKKTIAGPHMMLFGGVGAIVAVIRNRIAD